MGLRDLFRSGYRCVGCGKKISRDSETQVFQGPEMMKDIRAYFSTQSMKCTLCGAIVCGDCGNSSLRCIKCGGKATFEW